jgi:Cu-Zn family superoxide dismutase
MKTYIGKVVCAIFVGLAIPAYADSTTVTINAIDANGVGKQIGTIELVDTKDGLRITPQLSELPLGDHGFHVHVNPNCGPGNGPNGQPAAGMAAGSHTIRRTRGNTSGQRARVIRATCQCSPLMPAAKPRSLLPRHT